MKKIFAIMAGLTMACGLVWADTEHKVKAGETLQSIASQYSISVDALKSANPKAAKYVYAGMTLVIPSSDAVVTTTTTPATSPATSSSSTTSTTSTKSNASAPTSPSPKSKVAPGQTCPADQSVRSSAKKNSVNVEFGSLDSFCQSGAEARVIVDYSQCMVEGKKKLDQWLADKGGDWFKDWPKESANCHNSFCVFYNSRNKDNMQLSTISGTYQVVIRPEWIDFGDVGSQFNPFSTPKAGGCVMRGTITLYDPQGKALCQLWINDVKGLGEINFESRLRSMYQELGNRLKKVVKK